MMNENGGMVYDHGELVYSGSNDRMNAMLKILERFSAPSTADALPSTATETAQSEVPEGEGQ